MRILEVGVKAFIQNPDGKYLALLRAMPYYGEDFNRWDLPGGRIEIEETLEEALRREIFEETGLKNITIERIFTAQDLLRNLKKHTVRITYIVTSNADKVILNPQEHSDYKWVTLNEFRKLKHDLYLTPVLNQLKP